MRILKQSCLVAAIVMMPAFAVNGASFDCAAASTDVEKMVCADAELSALDSRLGEAYGRIVTRQRILSTNLDVAAVRREQRAWLRDVRDQCGSVACLKAVYLLRLNELTEAVASIDDKTVASICNEVRAAVNDGSLRQRFRQFGRPGDAENEAWAAVRPDSLFRLDGVLRVDYDGDGKDEVLGEFYSGGSCGACFISDMAAPLSGEPDWEDYRASRGFCDRFLFVRGEPVIVSAGQYYGRTGMFSGISWLAPGGAKRPLCTLTPAAEFTVSTVKADNAALCAAAASGRVDFIPWSVPLKISGEELRKASQPGVDGGFGSQEEYVLMTAELDIDEDGVKEIFAPYHYDSGAGCGAGFDWLLQIDPETRTIVDPPLQGAYMGEMNRIADLNPGAGEPRALFEYEGRPYILGESSVTSYWGGKTRTWCEFRTIRQHR